MAGKLCHFPVDLKAWGKYGPSFSFITNNNSVMIAYIQLHSCASNVNVKFTDYAGFSPRTCVDVTWDENIAQATATITASTHTKCIDTSQYGFTI